MKIIVFAMILGLALSDHPDTGVKKTTVLSLREELELVYKNVYHAIYSGDVPEYLLYTSQESKDRIHKVLDSLGREIDGVLLEGMQSYYKATDALSFVRTYKKPDMSALLYVSDSDMVGLDNKPRVTFTFIKFVKEKKSWKMDAMIHVGSLKYEEDDLTPMDLNLADVPFWPKDDFTAMPQSDSGDTVILDQKPDIKQEKKVKTRSRSYGRKKDF